MNLKKGVIAIVLFVFLSLTVYSFANPAEEDAITKLDGGKTTEVEEVENTFPEEENVLETEIEEEVTNRQVLTTESSTNRVVSNTTPVTNATTTTNAPTTPSNENTTIVENEKKEDYSSIVTKVDTLENMVEEAITTTLDTDMDKARDYNENEKIEELVSNINDEETKNNLEKRLGVIYTLLNDEVKPKITNLGIANLSHLKEGDKKVANVGDKIRLYVYLDEELSVNPIVKIEGVEKEIKLVRATKMSGIVYINDYTIKDIDTIKNGNIKFEVYGYKDNSNNEGEKVSSTEEDIMSSLNPYVNFDTKVPTFNIGNGASFESNVIEVNDENFDYMIIQDMTTGKKITVTEPTYELKPEGEVENGRFDFIAYDKAGNISKRTNYYLDNVKPYITGTGMIGETEVEFVKDNTYKSVKLNVIDKNLNKVVIYKDDVELETKTYAWNADKTTILEYNENGIYKIVLSDRANHVVEYTFTIDNRPAKVLASNILVNGDVNEQSEFYATNNDQVLAYVRFDKKLNVIPTFTFHNNGKDYVVDSSKVTEKEKNGEYTYSVLFDITPELDMTDGEITVSLSNIKDIAGNETPIVLKPTNGHKVYLDRTAPSIEWNGTIYGPEYTDKIITNKQFIANVIETGSGVDVIYQNGADRTYNGKVLNVSGHSSYKFEIIDKAGNKSTYNVILDKEEPKDISSDFYVNGQGSKKVYSANDGNTIVANIKTNEELVKVPTFTFHNNGNDIIVVGKYDGRDGKGNYTYSAKLKVTNELTDGELTYTISDIVDLAGNIKQTNITKPSNGRRVFIGEIIIKDISMTADGITKEFDTLKEALDNVQLENYENVKITVKDSHEINVNRPFTLGGTDTKFLTITGEDSSAKVIIDGNGTDDVIAGNENVIIKFNNIKVDDITEPYSTHWNFYYTEFDGNFNFTNVTFEHEVMTVIGNIKFDKCNFKGTDSGRYGIWVYGGNVTIKNSVFTGTRAIKLHSNYGTGETYWGNMGKVIVDNNTFTITEKPGVVIGHVNENTIINIMNNKFNNTTKPGDQNNWTIESDTVGPNIYENNTLNGVLHTLPNPYN